MSIILDNTADLATVVAAEVSGRQKRQPSGPVRHVMIVHLDPVSGQEIATLLHPTNANSKTGQGYAITHLLANVHPADSKRQGLDSQTVCRGCEYADGNGCYVVPMQLGSIYRSAFRNGNYYRCQSWEEFAHHVVECASFTKYLRFGNFGNPTMIPASVVEAICNAIKDKNTKLRAINDSDIRWTGYFRDWKVSKNVQYGYHNNFMYSVMSGEELLEVGKVGGRAFWSVPSDAVMKARAFAAKNNMKLIICPEQTHGVQCRDCGLCMGAKSRAAHILMPIHGNGEKKAIAAQGKLKQTFDC